MDALRRAAGMADTGQADIIDNALETVRRHLGMAVAYLSEFVDGRSVFRAVSAPGLDHLIKPGDSRPLAEVYCEHIIAGRLPQLIRDTADEPLAAAMPITSAVPIGSHVSVPIRRADGSVYGMFCCLAPQPNPSLNARDLAVVELFADVSAREVNRSLAARAQHEATVSTIRAIMDEGQFQIALQPIRDLSRHAIVGFEALCRFSPTPYRPPNVWFAEAAAVGLDQELEVTVAAKALETLAVLPDHIYLSINASPATIASGLLHPVLNRHPSSRVVLEVTEHAPVGDYDRLDWSLSALREGGLRLAVDDAGAGFAGLQHILRLRPDFIKLDMSLTRDIDTDFARRSLAGALLGFAGQTGAQIIAEGIETPGELAALAGLGVDRGQGYLLGRAGPVEAALAAMSLDAKRARRRTG